MRSNKFDVPSEIGPRMSNLGYRSFTAQRLLSKETQERAQVGPHQGNSIHSLLTRRIAFHLFSAKASRAGRGF